MSKRVFIAGFKHETNTFSKLPTDLAAYKARTYYRDDEVAHFARKPWLAAMLHDSERNRAYARAISKAAAAAPEGCVALEIGAGTGLLTQLLCKEDRIGHVVACEMEPALSPEYTCAFHVPEYAQVLRTLAAELSRILSHLLAVGAYALDVVGDFTATFMYAMRDREIVQNILEDLTGQRMMFNYFRLGGVVWDLPEPREEFFEKIRDFLDDLPEKQETEQLVAMNDGFFVHSPAAAHAPQSGLSSIALAIGGTGVFAFGMYKIIMGNRQRRCGAAPSPANFAPRDRARPLSTSSSRRPAAPAHPLHAGGVVAEPPAGGASGVGGEPGVVLSEPTESLHQVVRRRGAVRVEARLRLRAPCRREETLRSGREADKHGGAERCAHWPSQRLLAASNSNAAQ